MNFFSLHSDLINGLSSLKTHSGTAVDFFQLTNRLDSQFLSASDKSNSRSIDSSAEILNAAEFSERIIVNGIAQENYRASVARDHKVLGFYLEKIKSDFMSWLDQYESENRKIIDLRMACFVFLHHFKSQRLDSDEKLTSALQPVIHSIVNEKEVMDVKRFQKEMEDELEEIIRETGGFKEKFTKTWFHLSSSKEAKMKANGNNQKEIIATSEVYNEKNNNFTENENSILGGLTNKQEIREKSTVPEKRTESSLKLVGGNPAPKGFCYFKKTSCIGSIHLSSGPCWKGKGLIAIPNSSPRRYLALTSDGNAIVFFEKEQNSFEVQCQRKFEVVSANDWSCLDASPDGKLLAVAIADTKAVYLCNPENLESTSHWEDTSSSSEISSCCFISFSKVLVSYENGVIRVFEKGEDDPVYKAKPDQTRICVVLGALHPKQVYIGYNSRKGLVLWDLEKNKEIWSKKHHINTVLTLELNRPHKLLASGSFDFTVVLMDAETGDKLWHFKEFGVYIMKAEFTPSGDQLLVTTHKEQVLFEETKGQKWKKLASREKKPEETGFICSVATDWQRGISFTANQNCFLFKTELGF